MVNVSHIRTLSSVESTTSSPSIRLTVESIWNYAGNTLVNQHSDINKTHEILQDESKCEMIVVIENYDLIGKICRHSAARPDDR